jgi:phage terminase large subunit-like protein
MSNVSLAEQLAAMSDEERAQYTADFTDEDWAALEYDWSFWGRPNQIAPAGDWITLLWLAGRGFGKTRCGVEWIRSKAEGPTPLTAPPDAPRFIAMVAETAADARDVMVEGPAGVLANSPKDFRPLYEPSKRRLTWPNGIVATLYNAVEPDQLRGPQHGAAWCDELCKWRYADETWDQLQFGLRLGRHPQQVITTTPRPIKLLRDIIATPGTIVIRGSTYDNRANLAPVFYTKVVAKYEGTRLGRQELDAEVLDDVPGALFRRDNIDANRIPKERLPDRSFFRRITVNLDPAVSSGEEAAEHGITVTALGIDNHGYLLADESTQGTPDTAVARAVALYHEWQADRVVGEVNNGGEWIGTVIGLMDASVAYVAVHASRGKATRAEPISTLYEQNRVHHVGSFPVLEDQMCAFTPTFDAKRAGFSPDRLDSLVWGFSQLMLNNDDQYVPESQIVCAPFQIPTGWPKAFAMDADETRTFAVFAARDRTTDTIYVYTEHCRDNAEPSIHAAAIKARGAWIPGTIIQAARGRTEEDGENLIEMYRALGVSLWPAEKAPRSAAQLLYDRLSTGRLKVFTTCQQLLSSYRNYQSDADEKANAKASHGINALRVLVQSGTQRMAMPPESEFSQSRQTVGDKTVNY